MNPSERLLRQFRDLVTVRLERINRALMELEVGANVEAGRGALRELHGLKGEARMMGFDDINALVHEMEELVRCTEPRRYALSPDSTDALLSAADAVLVLSAAPPAPRSSPEVGRLVGWLQVCIRAEAGEALAPPGGDAAQVSMQEAARAIASARVVETAAAPDGRPPEPPGARAEAAPGPSQASAVGSGADTRSLWTAPTGMDRDAGQVGPGARSTSHATGAGGVVASGPSSAVGAHAVPGAPRSGSALVVSARGGVTGGSREGAEGRGEPSSVGRGTLAPTPASRGWPSAPRPETGASGAGSRGQGAPTAAASVEGASTTGEARAPGDMGRAAAGGTTVSRQPESRMDTAVRIGVASLDLLTSAVTNLAQVARRRERANARRLALARELGQLAREAEDLGPAAASLVARLGTAKELAAALHRESKLLSNEELRDLGMVMEEVQGLRMLPLSVLFEPYPRMVRDLSRTLGKEVELVIDGEDTRADRAVVEALREPLMHLVRNALDHGLETRVDRVSSGKHPRGCLTLRAAREGSRIILRVEDDGMGLDPAQLRRIAVRKGFLDESAANALSDAASRELIFLPGFTSREVATDLSGRGVGLDAVRASLQGLGGDVGVESAPGWGTIFELRAPVSLTVAPLLFIQVGTETLALSATHVSRALKVEPLHLCEVAGRPALLVEGRVLPLAFLGALLGLVPERPVEEGELVLVVRSQGGAAALVVDRVLEERVQAILPLRGLVARFTHLTGATSLADGRLAMVLSAAYLTASAQGTSAVRLPRSATPEAEARRRRVLVVDDSPLTRELLSNLLEAVGYDTVMAADGAEALDVLDAAPVDLVVTDLEMPGMDGLELTRTLKGHPVRSRLPVIILTTRGGEEDRRRGLAAGADGYITKGDLVRQDLVDVVGRLLG
ncbi:response regulator [Myxococcus stipitatus]|uniref:response regulator n=1 Tax=Myxococcus stipitatus TaxID=83455 RepID=UPI001F3DCA1F|nr:response regulator [Myxococcus stipitatus]MCE9667974.1 response regulator [Myxococcus stipitatus]